MGYSDPSKSSGPPVPGPMVRVLCFLSTHVYCCLLFYSDVPMHKYNLSGFFVSSSSGSYGSSWSSWPLWSRCKSLALISSIQKPKKKKQHWLFLLFNSRVLRVSLDPLESLVSPELVWVYRLGSSELEMWHFDWKISKWTIGMIVPNEMLFLLSPSKLVIWDHIFYSNSYLNLMHQVLLELLTHIYWLIGVFRVPLVLVVLLVLLERMEMM